MSPIYISPICNVEIKIDYSAEIIKLGILYFSLFTWYQSQKRKPNFLGDRVSFRSPFPPPDLLLTTASAAAAAVPRRPPPSLPPATSRVALLRPKTTYFEAQRADHTPVASPPKTDFPRAVTRVFSPAASPSTRRRVSARVGAWLLLRCRASTVRIVRRRLGVLALRRSIPSTSSPPFGHFCLRRGLPFLGSLLFLGSLQQQ